MAQLFANTPDTIYTVLSNDTVFTSKLGTYTFVDGSSHQSLALLTPGQQLPNLKAQIGLECIIHDTGDIRRRDYISGSSDMATTWKLFLIVWDPAIGSDLDFAAKRIMHLFSGSSSIETFAVASGARARVQTMILIPEDGGLHQDAVEILNSI